MQEGLLGERMHLSMGRIDLKLYEQVFIKTDKRKLLRARPFAIWDGLMYSLKQRTQLCIEKELKRENRLHRSFRDFSRLYRSHYGLKK